MSITAKPFERGFIWPAAARGNPGARPTPQKPAAQPAAKPMDSLPFLASDALVSAKTVVSARDALSKLIPAPEPAKAGTLDALLLELLAPMLRERLDVHLPEAIARAANRMTGELSGAAPGAEKRS